MYFICLCSCLGEQRPRTPHYLCCVCVWAGPFDWQPWHSYYVISLLSSHPSERSESCRKKRAREYWWAAGGVTEAAATSAAVRARRLGINSIWKQYERKQDTGGPEASFTCIYLPGAAGKRTPWNEKASSENLSFVIHWWNHSPPRYMLCIYEIFMPVSGVGVADKWQTGRWDSIRWCSDWCQFASWGCDSELHPVCEIPFNINISIYIYIFIYII